MRADALNLRPDASVLRPNVRLGDTKGTRKGTRSPARRDPAGLLFLFFENAGGVQIDDRADGLHDLCHRVGVYTLVGDGGCMAQHLGCVDGGILSGQAQRRQ